MARRARPLTVVVGRGRLARAILPSLTRTGYRVTTVVGEARLLLLAVPDRAIDDVATSLAGLEDVDWRGRVVLPHAGALGREALAPLARRGASTGVLHPLQCLGGGRGAADVLAGSRARIEGDRLACAAARRLARDLGLIPLRFRRELGPAERVAYHTAATLVANDLVALTALALELLESAGLKPRAGLRALLPLIRGTLAQMERGGLAAALSGPAARGDGETLGQQLRALGRRSAEDAELHRLLSRRLARIAAEHGALDAHTLARLFRRIGPHASRRL